MEQHIALTWNEGTSRLDGSIAVAYQLLLPVLEAKPQGG